MSVARNRYSVPFGLIGKTVQVVRQGGSWVIRSHGSILDEAEDIRRSIRLANRLGQNRVVTMSGLPAGAPAGSSALPHRKVENDS